MKNQKVFYETIQNYRQEVGIIAQQTAQQAKDAHKQMEVQYAILEKTDKELYLYTTETELDEAIANYEEAYKTYTDLDNLAFTYNQILTTLENLENNLKNLKNYLTN